MNVRRYSSRMSCFHRFNWWVKEAIGTIFVLMVICNLGFKLGLAYYWWCMFWQ